jgi:hypothetical protein
MREILGALTRIGLIVVFFGSFIIMALFPELIWPRLILIFLLVYLVVFLIRSRRPMLYDHPEVIAHIVKTIKEEED